MATKKPPPRPERVHSKSFNGAARGTVLRRITTPTADSYFGADFALVDFDHHPEPVWSAAQWLKKPAKADLYERWRAAPHESVRALVTGTTEEVLRACARIAGGQRAHHDGAARWVGLVRTMPLAEGTEVLLTLAERIHRDPAAGPFAEAAVLDGSEYLKSDFKYGPQVRWGEVLSLLREGLTRYWRYAVGDEPTTVAEALPERLRDEATRHLAATHEGGREHLHARLTRPLFGEAFRGGVSRTWNARCGLDDEFPMVGGTGY